MLEGARAVGFIPSVDLARARKFFEGTLGLSVLEETPFALVLSVSDGATLRLARTAEFTPAPYTIFGWEVENIPQVAAEMATRGIEGVRYPGLQQDALGIWIAPGGRRVFWFMDVDGNTLSLSERELRA